MFHLIPEVQKKRTIAIFCKNRFFKEEIVQLRPFQLKRKELL